MNSFSGNASSQKTPTPSSSSSYQFDFGLGSSTGNASKPLKDQKLKPAAAAAAPRPSPATPSWTQQPNKPLWTHQPATTFVAGSLGGHTSMTGDIFGKSWSSASPQPAVASTIGINKSNPNLFGDLVGSALNQGKSNNSNVPLKAAPARNSYSMGNLTDSMPKSGSNGVNSGSSMKQTWGSADNFGNLGCNASNNGNSMKFSRGSAENFGNFSSNQSSKPIGGQLTNSMSGVGSNTKQDLFASLMGFAPKNHGNAPIKQKNPAAGIRIDSSFGAFQNVKPADFGMSAPKLAKTEDFSFGDFKNAERSDFGIPSQPPSNQQALDPLDSLFSLSGNLSRVPEGEPFSEMNDWDVEAEFGGQDHSGPTTELEGLPPPPAGVTSSAAKTKGMDSYKQGQYADAIKWLSWAVVLIETNGDSTDAVEVLTSRASCYKEVGEYKKAVADCTKVLAHDGTNVSVLLQRALLYESTEKYRLGAEDLRMVLKIDPGNRLARSTIHRLNKMAE